jgi:hypothetical protein
MFVVEYAVCTLAELPNWYSSLVTMDKDMPGVATGEVVLIRNEPGHPGHYHWNI